jgi:dTDP-4-dehydrorhamnose reductase
VTDNLGVMKPLELWGGVECTVNRVGDRWFDQLRWSGHDVRSDDLSRFAALGLTALRYPVLWERLASCERQSIDWRWTDERLARLRTLGVRPILGLVHHGSGPAYTSLLDDRFAEKLARFAAAVAQRYPWVCDYTPVNEPLTTARFSGLYGHWYPHRTDDRAFVRALVNQLRGVVLAMRAIRECVPHARLVQTDDCGRTFGTADTRGQVIHECHRRWLTWDLLTGRVDDRHPLHDYLMRSGLTDDDERLFIESGCAPDVVGLNYYVTSDRYLDHRLDRYPPNTHGSNGRVRYADVDAVRGRPEGIVGHDGHLNDAWQRYRLPVAITETHLGCTREEQIRWLVESWDGANRARAKGANVAAVTAWALLGSFNWSSLVTRDEQSYEPGAFDVRGRSPRATALAAVVRMLASGAEARHPALDGAPWWRRPDRLLHTDVSRTPVGDGPTPVLIIGATGTLGRAFARACENRRLPYKILSRHEMDITDPRRVATIMKRLQPWAVINAAGYVRVDAAEHDWLECHRVNVVGPVNLAAACRRHGVPLVTFSSDLVFDGLNGGAYVETDEPHPLNVYGATKAEAERRVLELLPSALVIRTSAFFGPWDDYNYLAHVFRALDAGATFSAPADAVVSPTYVPDLVDATIDLLIDGEGGLWHVANDGACSWFEFARAVAARSGRRADLIVACETARVWGPARRPPYAPLRSERTPLLRPLGAAVDAYLAALDGSAPRIEGCATL